jgi:ATP-dependent DNA helicase RecQ
VYCASRRSAEELAGALKLAGSAALPYHAGLSAEERAKNQEAFLRDEVPIICATIAFGMGINKPNVRWVLHADLPKNIEGYYQETGRAGRDGLPAECLLLYSRGDVAKQLRFLEEIPDEDVKAATRRQLDLMVNYAESAQCRRIGLLGYFGESWPEQNCGACDNCLEPREMYDASTDALKFLSCVVRIQQWSNFSTGMNHIVDVLRGADTERIRKWEHHRVTTYGIGKEKSRADWLSLASQLMQLELIDVDSKFGSVGLTIKGRGFLKNRPQLQLAKAHASEASQKTASKASRTDIPCDTGLFEELRHVRKALADTQQVPPYVVFSDVSLRHMAREYPTTAEAFLRIPGVGQQKLERYGLDFLAAISSWLGTHDKTTFVPLESVEKPVEREFQTLSSTVMDTLERFQQGLSPAEIAEQRKLAPSTIESHLAAGIAAGVEIELARLLAPSELRELKTAFSAWMPPALSTIYEELQGRYSYSKLKYYAALKTRNPEQY